MGEKKDYMDKCTFCLENVPDAKIRPCSHSATCREYAQELIKRSEPCPLCRKPISSFDIGVYSDSLGARRLWPTSYKSIRELVRNDDSNSTSRGSSTGTRRRI